MGNDQSQNAPPTPTKDKGWPGDIPNRGGDFSEGTRVQPIRDSVPPPQKPKDK